MFGFGSSVAPTGAALLKVRRGGSESSAPGHDINLRDLLRYGFPHPGLPREVFQWRLSNIPNLARDLWRIAVARLLRIPHFYGQVWLVKFEAGLKIDLGLASLRVVTTDGVNFIVDAFQNLTEVENFKYHGFGTGATAEAVGDTALVTELTTQYNPDSTRPTGTQTEGASANIYRTVATLSPDTGGTIAITEHGIFSAASGGTLLDRSVFSAVNLVAGSDSLQVTYDLTLTAGS